MNNGGNGGNDGNGGEWKPIETAPKDGSYFLAVTGHEPFWSYDVASLGWFDNEKPVWYNGDCSIEPDYWMPLPEPPRIANEK